MLRLILLSVVSCLVHGAVKIVTPKSQLTVSSTGPAATKQGTKMGQYTLITETINKFPVYEKTDGAKNYLYVSSNGLWTVGSKKGSTVSGLYNTLKPAPSSPPPASGWLYVDGADGWKSDDGISVVSVVPTPASDPTAEALPINPRSLTPGSGSLTDRELIRGIFEILAGAEAAAPAAPEAPDKPGVRAGTGGTETAAAPDKPVVSAGTRGTGTTGCPATITVAITPKPGLGTGNDVAAAVNFAAYRGTYTLDQGRDGNGNPTYTGGNGATIRKVIASGTASWEMRGVAAINIPSAAVSAQPHLVNNINGAASCPPPTGWRFRVSGTAFSSAPDADVVVM